MKRPGVAREYGPWLLVGWCLLIASPGLSMGLHDGVYVGNGTDMYSYQLPMRRLVRALLSDGEISWNPYILGGVPLLAGWQLGLLYPPNLVAMLGPPEATLGWLTALHIGILSLGGAALLNAWGRRPLLAPRGSAALGAALFVGAGVTWGHIWPGHVSFLQVWAWTPWTWALALECWRSPAPRTVAVLAGVATLQALAGHPQVLYLTLVGGLFLLVGFAVQKPADRGSETQNAGDGTPSTWHRPAAIAAAGVLAVLAAAVQLLPAWLLAPELNRALASPESIALAFSAPPHSLLTAIAPTAFGGTQARLAAFSYHETLAHFGAVGSALVIVAAARPRPATLVLLVGVGVCAAMSPGKYGPLLPALHDIVPGLGTFRVPSRWLVPCVGLGAVLAGDALDRLGTPRDGLARWLAPVGLAAAAVALWTAANGVHADSGWWHALLTRTDGVAPAKLVEVAEGVRSALIGAGVVAAAVAAFATSRANHRWFGVILVIVAAGEASAFAGHHIGDQAFMARSRLNWSAATARTVSAAVGDGQRLGTASRLRHANWAGALGVASAGGYEPAVAQWTNRYANRFAGRPSDRYAVNLQVRRPSAWLDRAATSHLLHHRRDLSAAREFAGWPIAAKVDELVVRRNPRPWPRLAGADKVAVQPDRGAALDALATLDRRTTLLDHALAHTESAKLTIERVQWGPTRITATVLATEQAVLVLRDTALTGWTAHVDGAAVQQAVADGAFRAVTVPKGRHEVRWSYRAPGLMAGGALSGVGLLAIIGLFFAGRRRKDQPATSLPKGRRSGKKAHRDGAGRG